MSELQRLVDGLHETGCATKHLERAVSESPDDEILRINAQSVAKRHADLIRRIDMKLNASQNELVRYRIKRDSDRYPAIAKATAPSQG